MVHAAVAAAERRLSAAVAAVAERVAVETALPDETVDDWRMMMNDPRPHPTTCVRVRRRAVDCTSYVRPYRVVCAMVVDADRRTCRRHHRPRSRRHGQTDEAAAAGRSSCCGHSIRLHYAGVFAVVCDYRNCSADDTSDSVVWQLSNDLTRYRNPADLSAASTDYRRHSNLNGRVAVESCNCRDLVVHHRVRTIRTPVSDRCRRSLDNRRYSYIDCCCCCC